MTYRRQRKMMKGNAALRVAITGANGNLGRKLVSGFLAAPGIAIDRDVAGLFPADARVFPIQADLRGPGFPGALAGIDAVIHLAAQNPYPDASWEDASASFDMTAKLIEACANASVSRLVFASSNHVMGGYKDTPVALSDGELTTDLPPRVGTLVKTSEGLIDSTAYAAAKLMGERVLAVKAETGAFTGVLLRIGWCQPGENTPQTISAAGTQSPACSKQIRSVSVICAGSEPCGSRTAISSGRFSQPRTPTPLHGHLGPSSSTRCPQIGLRPGTCRPVAS
jgi:nucleoside-diphosphate-sugar epimerase